MMRENRTRVKIGVVGLGRFGRLHSLTLAGLAEAELVGVVARRQENIDALRRELPEVPGWTSLDAAIAESGAEAWVVACTTAAHVPVTAALLRAGKTVLLEKPIAATLAEAESLAPLVKPDSANLMIGHIVLFNSEFRAVRDEAARRGKIEFIDCVRHRPASIVKSFPGENPLQAAMVHDLYAIQALLQRAEPVGFSAQFHYAARRGAIERGSVQGGQVHFPAAGRDLSGNASSPENRPDPVDLALAQLQWSDGTLASCTASYMTPEGMAPRGFDRMEVFGRGWAARISPNPRPVEVWDDQARWPMALEIRADAGGPTGMMAEELRCFCRVVQGTEPVPVGATYADAMQVQRWMERLEASAGERGILI
jgi:predicted dehydrogenase